MTWGELRDALEAAGVPDDAEIVVAGWVGRTAPHVTIDVMETGWEVVLS